MPVIVVANPKGGVGKTTLSTNLAGYLASRGRAVMLGDVDRQQSSRTWLGLRPDGLPPISAWEVSEGEVVRPPKGTTHIVLDTPAGLHGKRLDEVMKLADKVLIPLQPSIFDIHATHQFIDELLAHRRSSKVQMAVVGMRTREGTISTDQLRSFETIAEFKDLVGQEIGVSDWITVTQERIQLFADATNYHQWIHLDAERAKAGPFGTTIAHGFLTLSLLPEMAASAFGVRETRMGVNYGLNKVRFPAPVPSGSRLRGRFKLIAYEPLEGGAQVTVQVTMEREGSDKPVCIAESIGRRYA